MFNLKKELKNRGEKMNTKGEIIEIKYCSGHRGLVTQFNRPCCPDSKWHNPVEFIRELEKRNEELVKRLIADIKIFNNYELQVSANAVIVYLENTLLKPYLEILKEYER